MKILESSPERYDRGIAILSFGASERVKRQLVDEVVHSSEHILEIGCGTGTLAVLAAAKGAAVTGFDISKPMLDIARTKVEAAGLADRVNLLEMGVSGMAELTAESFDAVVSTLVFSELSPDEQDFALRHAHRVLKAAGTLAIADEVVPEGFVRRFVHSLLRLPLALITFLVAQTTTRAVKDIGSRVGAAGFDIIREERSALGSFLYLTARKRCP